MMVESVERRCHHGQLNPPCPLCLEEEGHAIRDYVRAMAFRAEIAMNQKQLSTNMNKAEAIYRKYVDAYNGEVQGCCPLIADEIQHAIGGEVVAGELTWYGGSCRRTHWWVEKDGQIIDPMGDNILSFEDAPGRLEAHRNRGIFERILPDYERWRR